MSESESEEERQLLLSQQEAECCNTNTLEYHACPSPQKSERVVVFCVSEGEEEEEAEKERAEKERKKEERAKDPPPSGQGGARSGGRATLAPEECAANSYSADDEMPVQQARVSRARAPTRSPSKRVKRQRGVESLREQHSDIGARMSGALAEMAPIVQGGTCGKCARAIKSGIRCLTYPCAGRWLCPACDRGIHQGLCGVSHHIPYFMGIDHLF